MANGNATNGTSNGTAADTVVYGVTDQGFIVKPFQAILQDAYTRAQLLFGPDIDLRSSSTMRKLLELVSLEDALSWMQLDGVYNSAFVATASGLALDRLGTDLGLDRGYIYATGVANFKLSSNAQTNCVYTLPPGTLVDVPSSGPGVDPIRFSLGTKITLVLHNPPDGSEQAQGTVTAVLPGQAGNIPQKTLTVIDPDFAARYLSFDSSVVVVSNLAAFTGGDVLEDDDSYRARLYALPRSLWTVEAVRQTVLALDGVRDALVNDPYGGLDKATQPFGEFCFNDQQFQAPRELCNPYFFTIVVAPKPGVLWESSGNLTGLHDQILDAIQPIRPISIFPSIDPADIVQIALRVQLTLSPGTDSGTVLAAALLNVGSYINSLRLGDAVLYAQVLRILAEIPNVLNVQDLHLRRCPPRFGEIVCGPPAKFGNDTNIAAIEAPCGGDIALAPTEVAVFAAGTLDSLMEVTLS
jgi:hypothetical protein